MKGSSHPMAFGLAAFALAALAAPRARACDQLVISEPRFYVLDAPPGGLWWFHGTIPRGTTITLTDTEGHSVEARIASRGNVSSIALRVPDLPPGTRFPFPVDFDSPADASDEAFLTIGPGPPPVVEAARPPAPELGLIWDEVRVGHEPLLVWPFEECGPAPGFWNNRYADRPALTVRGLDDSVVLDVHLKPEDEEPFRAADPDEILADGQLGAEETLPLVLPRDSAPRFFAHARVRRIADAVASEVVSVEVSLEDVPVVERLEWVGCDCGGTGTPASLLPALVCLGLLRRLRRRRPPCSSTETLRRLPL